MDKRTRAFIWTYESTCNGGEFKVVWENVTKAKLSGGLGIKYLAKQNKCFLQKFLIRFHSDEDTPWLSWVRTNYGWTNRRDFEDDLSHATLI
ncbi:hypothetical protein PR202_ga15123 [Eleusine coracana subsp. coracana]|uniref:Uncharacterized protein n=1 Tax=Eleusine coracana subsp. coracana TaxID=191504 RepID=A0AAV5CJ72_ELECO|nr:hypothetical protein PR202_ga15123 [Eleusine coracana subsp. coracana]